MEALLAKAAVRCPALAGVEADFAWSGVFGETDDSPPMIGRVPGRPHCLAAFGYGGNGITFSALAADLLEAELEARHRTMRSFSRSTAINAEARPPRVQAQQIFVR